MVLTSLFVVCQRPTDFQLRLNYEPQLLKTGLLSVCFSHTSSEMLLTCWSMFTISYTISLLILYFKIRNQENDDQVKISSSLHFCLQSNVIQKRIHE